MRPSFEFCWIKLPWRSCSMWDKSGWLKWFWQFLCERLSSFNPTVFYYSYAWSHSLCERRTFFCTGLISRKLCRLLLIFSTGFTSFSVLLLFLYRSPSLSLCKVFDSISSNIDEILSITHLLIFVFWDFNVHHKDWLTYSSGSDKPGEFRYNFSNDLTQTVNFPTRIPDCDSHSPALTHLFISSDANICSTMVFPPLGNSDHVAVSVSIDFPSNSQRDPPFHRIAYDYSRCWLGGSSWSFERCSMGGYL